MRGAVQTGGASLRVITRGVRRVRRAIGTTPQLSVKNSYFATQISTNRPPFGIWRFSPISGRRLGRRLGRRFTGKTIPRTGTLMIYLYLRGVHPTSVHLMGGCLMGVYLTGVHLMGIHFMGMHLIGVRLIGMCLMGVHLMGMCLMGVHLTGVHLMGCTLYSHYQCPFAAFRTSGLQNRVKSNDRPREIGGLRLSCTANVRETPRGPEADYRTEHAVLYASMRPPRTLDLCPYT
jgi:hypothetical protein